MKKLMKISFFSLLLICCSLSGCIREENVYHSSNEKELIGDLGDDATSLDKIEFNKEYYFTGSDIAKLSGNVSGVSNDCITLVSHDLRLSKILVYGVVPFDGIVTNFELSIIFDTGDTKIVKLPYVVGGVLTQFIFDLPQDVSSYSIEYCRFVGTDLQLSGPVEFGKNISKLSDNTIHSEIDGIIFLFNDMGCCKGVFEVEHGNDYITVFDVDHYREVEK